MAQAKAGRPASAQRTEHSSDSTGSSLAAVPREGPYYAPSVGGCADAAATRMSYAAPRRAVSHEGEIPGVAAAAAWAAWMGAGARGLPGPAPDRAVTRMGEPFEFKDSDRSGLGPGAGDADSESLCTHAIPSRSLTGMGRT